MTMKNNLTKLQRIELYLFRALIDTPIRQHEHCRGYQEAISIVGDLALRVPDIEHEERHIMTKWTVEELNLDGMSSEELHQFMRWVGNGVRPIAAAKELFPQREAGFVRATKDLRNYAWNKITAMACRVDGRIDAALAYERICDRIYAELPEWAKW
jgi:hypothetical protein